jgi:hypothetical protein
MNEAGPATRSGIAYPVENEHEQKTAADSPRCGKDPLGTGQMLRLS